MCHNTGIDISRTDVTITTKILTYYDYPIICKLCKMVVYLSFEKLQTLIQHFNVDNSETTSN